MTKPRVRYLGMSGDAHAFRIFVATGRGIWTEDLFTALGANWNSVLGRIKEIQRW